MSGAQLIEFGLLLCYSEVGRTSSFRNFVILFVIQTMDEVQETGFTKDDG
jgi:hypothetical protein